MKTKNFQNYLETRLNKREISKLEKQAILEKKALQNLQSDISKIVTKYMNEEKVGFNELVRRLGSSPSQVTKIRKGEANLTIASLAHIFALLNRKPHIITKTNAL